MNYMLYQETERSTGMRHPRVIEALVHSIGTSLSTLNLDIHLTRDMPPILPGKKGVRGFVKALREGNFENLAKAIEVVHVGENGIGKNKRNLSRRSATIFETYFKVITDMKYTIGENASLLNEFMIVPDGHYRGDQTRVGELVLTFYELVLKDINTSHPANYYPANQRASSLSTFSGFTLSPLMQETIT